MEKGGSDRATLSMLERRHFAVVGGGGYVGWNLAQKLLMSDPECSVCVIDINFPISEQNRAFTARMTFVKMDIRNADALLRCFLDYTPETVFHVASYGMSGKEMLNKRLIEEVNVGGVQNVLNACIKSSVGRLVYTSTYNTVFGGQEIINGNEATQTFLPLYLHPDHYALTKSIGEQLILMADRKLCADNETVLHTCALRLAGIYGPDEQRHLPRIVDYLEKGWVKFVYGEGIVDFVHIDNVVQAHIKAADALTSGAECVAAGKSYFISDGQPIKNFEFFRPLIEGLEYPFPTMRLPLSLVFYIAIALEYIAGLKYVIHYNLDRHFPLLTPTEVFKTGVTHYFSIEKARMDLRYEPRLPPNDLEETVRRFRLAGRQRKPVTVHRLGTPQSIALIFVPVVILVILFWLWI